MNLADLSETHQAYLEQHRSAQARLDEEPWDADLRELVDGLEQNVAESHEALDAAWRAAQP